jgi:type I restriction enzyme R subunit
VNKKGRVHFPPSGFRPAVDRQANAVRTHTDRRVRNVVTDIKDRLEENETLLQQAHNNTLAQFSASPDLQNEFVGAVIGAMASSEDLSNPDSQQPRTLSEASRWCELVPIDYKGLKAAG